MIFPSCFTPSTFLLLSPSILGVHVWTCQTSTHVITILVGRCAGESLSEWYMQLIVVIIMWCAGVGSSEGG